MITYTIAQAQANLNQLIDKAAQSHLPIYIVGKKSNAVLVSQKDWSAIQETLYLLPIPGMKESIKNGLKTPLNNCDQKLSW